MCLDLCSEEAFESVEPYTDLLPPKVTLEWVPGVKSSNDILASEIVVAAVGRGKMELSLLSFFYIMRNNL